MDSDKNRTSFVVIAAHPEYDADCDLISVSFSAAHRSGALCEALLPFTAAGVNLTRIESRPSAALHTYRFFAEISGNIKDSRVVETLGHAANVTEYFEVLGCYRQV
jgi:chorismate mutase/prephenate dehydratase